MKAHYTLPQKCLLIFWMVMLYQGYACTPDTFWKENFSLSNGTTSDNGSTAWTRTVSGSGTYAVHNNEFRSTNSGSSGEGVWRSEIITITGKTDVAISANVRSAVINGAQMNSSGSLQDYIRVYYKLNGGSEILVNEYLGAINNHSTTFQVVSATGLAGSSIQVVIRTRATGNDEFYFVDDVKVKASLTASAFAASAITCSSSTAQLNGSASISDVSYAWTGPGGFSSSQQSPVVSAPGTYTLTVTNNESGCTATAVATVNDNRKTPFWSETFTFSNGTTSDNGSTPWTRTVTGSGTLQVQNNTLAATCMGNSSGTVGVWTSGVINIAGKSDVQISADLRSAVFNGNSMEQSGSDLDYVRFYYKLNGGAEILFAENNAAVNNHSATLTTFAASGFSGSTLQLVIRVRATSCDEYYYLDNVTLSSGFTASATGGTLTCTTSSVTITGTSSATTPAYQWSGPGGFSASTASATVTVPGTYNLTVTDNATGCTANASAIVTNSSTNALWNENFSLSNGTTSDNGTTAWTTTSTGNGTFAVDGNEFVATGLGTSGSQAVWTSASIDITGKTNVGISANLKSVVIGDGQMNPSGDIMDFVRFYYKLNGGAEVMFAENIAEVNNNSTAYTNFSVNGLSGSSLQIIIKTRVTGTDEFYYFDDVKATCNLQASAAVAGTITCVNPSVTISGSASIPGVTYAWTGPGGFTAAVASTSVTTAGTYNLTVTNPANGCTATASVVVASNLVFPGATINTPSTIISCTNPSVVLTGSSPTSGVTYSWSRVPSGFSATTAVVTATVAGNYILTVTNPTNGCATSTAQNVSQNTTIPEGITAGKSGDLSCINSSVTLNGSSTTATVNYSWSGPAGFTTVNAASATTNIPGTYTLKVTHAVSGCSTTTNLTVGQNVSVPASVAATVSGPITCLNPSVTLSGSSSTAGVGFQWSGPGGFSSTLASVAVNTAGTYNLLVTHPSSGCTATTIATVTQNNTLPGTVTASVSGPITCSTPTVTISGSSSSGSSSLQYQWSGPSGFSATTASASVSIAGTYSLIVSDITNGCSSAPATVVVTGNSVVPASVTASVSGPVTCIQTTATITGSSTTSGVSYQWSGPGGYTSSAPSNVVSAAGTYLLTITNTANGCSGTASVEVVANTTPPANVNASVNSPITCASPEVTLSGSSSTSGVTYSWTGPGGFTSANASNTINMSGLYVLVVQNPANGCSSDFSVNVLQNTTPPQNITASVSGTISCNQTNVTLTGNSTTPGVSYTWSGPGGFTASGATASASAIGLYTVTVFNPVNGCSSTGTVSVTGNNSSPLNVAASVSGPLTCSTSVVTISGTSTSTAVQYNWTGPGAYSSSLATNTVSVAGTYTLTVTDTLSGCSAASVSVTVVTNATPPVVSASVSGALTCTTSIVTISGTSSISGSSFLWTGPGGFSAATASASVSAAGTYQLTVSSPTSGCSATTSVNVVQNTTAPAGVSASVSGQLTCSVGVVTISGTSSTPSVTYAWTGPGTYSASTASATANTAGTYTLVVRNPSNGCTTTTSVVVQSNVVFPGATISTPASILSCTNPSLTLTGSSPTAGVTYTWTRIPSGFSATTPAINVTVAGNYILTVRNPVNNCATSTTQNVNENKIVPAGLVVNKSNDLSCSITSVNLAGSSTTSMVQYSWSGPVGFTTVNTATATTNIPGTYTFKATHSISGCTATAALNVLQSNAAPENVIAQVNGILSCTQSSVLITASSSTAGVTYQWSGPGGFSSTSASATVNTPGIYSVTVRNPVSGCTVVRTVDVLQNISIPLLVTASVSGSITCAAPEVSITGSTSTSTARYLWSGPGGFSSALASNLVNEAGTYTLVVTDTVSGCSANSIQIVVTGNTNPPSFVNATVSGEITCLNTSVTISGSTITPNVRYSWTGPGGFTSNQANNAVAMAGAYTLVVTDTINGCAAVAATVQVIENTAGPSDLTVSVSGPITCSTPSVSISGNSSSSGILYQWSGPGGYSASSPTNTVSVAGTYTLVVSDTANGCSSQETLVVTENKTLPVAAVATSDGPITCNHPEALISVVSNASGIQYTWNGPGGFVSNNLFNSVNIGGTYSVIATDTSNGCSSAASSVVIEEHNTFTGEVIAFTGNAITCTNTTANILGISTIPSVHFSWNGPGGFTSNSDIITVSEAGVYVLQVTDTINGCSRTTSVNVLENTAKPALDSLTVSGTINCTDTAVTISAHPSLNGVLYAWSGPGGFSFNEPAVTVTAGGTYFLTITDPVNGCTTDTSIAVIQSNSIPLAVTATVSGIINCMNSTVQIQGTSASGNVSYQWSGPGGYTSSSASNNVGIAGTYTLVVSDAVSGCSANAVSIIVVENTNVPVVSAAVSGPINCIDSVVTISAISSSPVQFQWSGPGAFAATTASAQVQTEGIYTVVASDTINGCQSQQSVTVSKNTMTPAIAMTSVSGIITCNNPVIAISASSTSPVSYQWSGPGGFLSSFANNTVSTPGVYNLVVTDTINGCESAVHPLSVIANLEQPTSVVASVSGPITCEHTSVLITGSSSTTSVHYLWSGPGGFTSAAQSSSVNIPGVYNLTVTDTINGCSTSGVQVNVSENNSLPNSALATVSGIITCMDTSVTISASALGTPLQFEWSGPGGYTSSSSSNIVNTAGTYTVKISNTQNGCFVTQAVVVSENKTLPDSVLATVNGIITCTNPSVTISGYSSTTGAVLQWSGPASYSSANASNAVNTAGLYTLVATNPANGCTASASVTVLQNTHVPENVSATVNRILTCLNTVVTIKGTSTSSGLAFSWTGPEGFTSVTSSNAVTVPGTYQLTVTDTLSGCSALASVVVLRNLSQPSVEAFVSGPITCIVPAVTISCTSSSGVYFQWSGPNGYSSSSASNSVSEAGSYSVFVTDSISGCTSGSSVDVLNNSTFAGDVISFTSGSITCVTPSVSITGLSTIPQVHFSWSGPNGFTSSFDTATVSAPGIYVLSVTDTLSGCVFVTSLNVLENKSKPESVVLSVSGPITCADSLIQVTANSSTPDVSYLWTGPGGYSSTEDTNTVTTAGTYLVSITNEVNGCVVDTSVVVSENKIIPSVQTFVSGTITCLDSIATISASTSSTTASAVWTGPNGYHTTLFSNQVSVAGNYSVIITDTLNGCSSASVSVSVTENKIIPVATAHTSGNITCINNTVNISASSDISGANFLWGGPGGFSSTNVVNTVSSAGTYILVATNPDNGCSSAISSVEVIDNSVFGGTVIAFTNGAITCNSSSVLITGISTLPSVLYEWSGPGGFISTYDTVTVFDAGIYLLKVTDTINGCSEITSVNVLENTEIPEIENVQVSGEITCLSPTATLNGTSTTPGVNYEWSGPGGYNANTGTVVVTAGGTYEVTISNPVNGCFAQRSATVIENKTIPVANASVSGPINCVNTSVSINGSSSGTSVNYLWSGPGGYSSTASVNTVNVAGAYTLAVTDTTNGCISLPVTVNVETNTTAPASVTASISSQINCTNPFVTITGSSGTTSVHYSWSGPSSFTSTAASNVISVAGVYNLTVTDTVNGCTATASVTAVLNKTLPNINISNTSGSTILTCFINPLTFTGSSTTPGATFAWTNTANTVIATTAVVNINAADIYTLTVTGPNGCKATRTRTVTQTLNAPVATATASGTVNCSTSTTATLTGLSSGTPASYSWTGPGGFTSSLQNPGVVSVGGTYTLTVTTPGNCVSTDTALVHSVNCPPAARAAGDASLQEEQEQTVNTSALVRVFPNPLAGIGVVEFSLPEEGEVQVDLISMDNVLISSLVTQYADNNKMYRLHIDANHYTAGVYLIKVTQNNRVYMQRLIIAN